MLFSVPDFGSLRLLHPRALFLLFLLPFVYFLIFKSFVKVPLDSRRRHLRWWLFFTRTFLVVLLVLVLATPYGEVRVLSEGSPRIILLVDNSSSMRLFDLSFISGFKKSLERYLPVTVRTVALGNRSALGDGILQHLQQDASLLVVSDGRSTHGVDLTDVGLFASDLNATINYVKLVPREQDVSVFVLGPSETLADVDNVFQVVLTGVGRDSAHVSVFVDNESVVDEVVKLVNGEGSVSFSASFSDGFHRIVARVSDSDFFPVNNEFLKVVRVLDKPKILYVGNVQDPVVSVLEGLFDVDAVSRFPSNLSSYYAVVVNDQPVGVVEPFVSELSDFLVDAEGGYYGNGLFVIGGFDSFDRGGYKGSAFESLLPVRVGKAQKRKGNQNLMFVIDLSGSLGASRLVYQEDGTWKEVRDRVAPIEILKMRVLDVLDVLDPTHRVGATVFGLSTRGRSFFSYQEAIGAAVKRLEPPVGKRLEKYYDVKKRLMSEVRGLSGGGPSVIPPAYRDAMNVLADEPGDKRIIILTDGFFAEKVREKLVEYVRAARRMGIQTFVIGVGHDGSGLASSFLRDEVAREGGGLFVDGKSVNKVKILFGDPENKKFGDDFSLFYLSLNHFITRDLDAMGVYPVFNGWNYVIPKTAAKMLVTTDAGDPALTVWRYGNGRVAVLNVFRGDSIVPLLTHNNSVLLTRIVNWVVGDPERKLEYFVDVPDTFLGERGRIVVRSDRVPSSRFVNFSKEGRRTYVAEFRPSEEGFASVLGVPYAVNYPREFLRVGFNSELERLSELTWSVDECAGGFSPGEVGRIVECAKSANKKLIIKRTTVIWPLVLAFLVVYFFELVVRRFYEKKR